MFQFKFFNNENALHLQIELLRFQNKTSAVIKHIVYVLLG